MSHRPRLEPCRMLFHAPKKLIDTMRHVVFEGFPCLPWTSTSLYRCSSTERLWSPCRWLRERVYAIKKEENGCKWRRLLKKGVRRRWVVVVVGDNVNSGKLPPVPLFDTRRNQVMTAVTYFVLNKLHIVVWTIALFFTKGAVTCALTKWQTKNSLSPNGAYVHCFSSIVLF